MIRVLGNAELDAANAAVQETPEQTESTPQIPALVAHVRRCWDNAVRHKHSIQAQLLANLRQYNSEYDPQKLAEIRKLKGSEVFLGLTVTKCNAAMAWLSDILFQPNARPWDIEATPQPSLPPQIEQQIQMEVYQDVSQTLGMVWEVTGQDPQQLIQRVLPEMDERVKRRIREFAREEIEKLRYIMDDQLVEGGWYDALLEVLFDIVVFKAGIIKGPMLRRIRTTERQADPMTGKMRQVPVDKIVKQFERRSPFNIYPAPGAFGSIQNVPYVFDKLTLTPKQLEELRGVPGYDDAAITSVLENYRQGSLRDWTSFDTTTEYVMTGQVHSWMAEVIDVLEFWGSVKGELLLEWGVDLPQVNDPNRFYDIRLHLVQNDVISVMLNPDPMGTKPFSMTSYVKRPDSVWGDGLPELLVDAQQICNAMARSIVNNSGIASGPLVEYNEDRMMAGYDPVLYPWKSIPTSDMGMSGSPAVRFYQPKIVVMELLQVLQHFSKQADEYTIPSFAHGSGSVTGAGKTASGLSMLMSSANRIIKHVVKNVDTLIEDSIRRLYAYNVIFEPEFTYLGDINISARGSSSMIQREQQAVRRTEFLTATNNPADLAIMGNDGRRELLSEVVRTMEFERPERILPEIDSIDLLRMEAEQLQQQIEAESQSMLGGEEAEEAEEDRKNGSKSSSATKIKPKTVDRMGEQPSGQSSRQFRQSEVGQMRPKFR